MFRRKAQCTAFQLATGHAFHATYSLRFRAFANDTITCQGPSCVDKQWTLRHYLEDCDLDWEIKGTLVPYTLIENLFSTYAGGRALTLLLDKTKAFSKPLRRPTF